MAENETSNETARKLSNSELEKNDLELPECTSCRIIGAGACFCSSAYLLFKRNTFGQTPVSRSLIGIVAAGLAGLGVARLYK